MNRLTDTKNIYSRYHKKGFSLTIFQNIINVTTIEKEQPAITTSKEKIGRMAVGRMAIGKEEPEAALLKGTVSTSYVKLCMR